MSPEEKCWKKDFRILTRHISHQVCFFRILKFAFKNKKHHLANSAGDLFRMVKWPFQKANRDPLKYGIKVGQLESPNQHRPNVNIWALPGLPAQKLDWNDQWLSRVHPASPRMKLELRCAMVVRLSRFFGDKRDLPPLMTESLWWVYKPLLLGWWPSPIIWWQCGYPNKNSGKNGREW